MSGEIEHMISLCDKCQTLRQSQHDKPQIVPKANALMHCVSTDLCSFGGHEYIVMADRFSFYLWCAKLLGTSTSDILKVVDKWFLEAGYLRQIISDNGPQFRTEFNNCLLYTSPSPRDRG